MGSAPLPNDRMHVNVLFLGQEPAALITAHLLAREGVQVALAGAGPTLEREVPAWAQGLEGLPEGPLHQARWRALDLLEDLCRDVAPAACRRHTGLLSVGDPMPHPCLMRSLAEAGIEARPSGSLGVAIPRQLWVEARSFFEALNRATAGLGGLFIPGARALDALPGSGFSAILQDGARLRADRVVLASPSPLDDLLDMQGRLHTYRAAVLEGLVPAGDLPAAALSDGDGTGLWRIGEGPDGQVRVRARGFWRRWRGGTAPDHPALEAWVRRFMPIREVRRVPDAVRREGPDGVGLLGEAPWGPDRVLVARGGLGSDLAGAALAALVLRDLILGRPHPLAALCDPRRAFRQDPVAFPAVLDAIRWESLRWLTPHCPVPPGGGGVIREGGARAAHYRWGRGRLRPLAAHCPRQDRPVAWDSVRRTWSCPCHGAAPIAF